MNRNAEAYLARALAGMPGGDGNDRSLRMGFPRSAADAARENAARLPAPDWEASGVGRAGAALPSLAWAADDAEWPLRSFLPLGALPGAVPCARLHARQLMWEWGLAESSDDVELLTSELVTNAVQASRRLAQPSAVRLWLRSDTARVLILVWDASPQPPVRVDAAGDAEGGRGLLLVDTISDRWDWYATQQPDGGKLVWALSAPH
jgi:anti-sigma regulatory factor (Ser/Thr protein kinase)